MWTKSIGNLVALPEFPLSILRFKGLSITHGIISPYYGICYGIHDHSYLITLESTSFCGNLARIQLCTWKHQYWRCKRVEGGQGTKRPSAGAAGCTVHNPECAVRLGYTVSWDALNLCSVESSGTDREDTTKPHGLGIQRMDDTTCTSQQRSRHIPAVRVFSQRVSFVRCPRNATET